jgi:hypothetical protein
MAVWVTALRRGSARFPFWDEGYTPRLFPKSVQVVAIKGVGYRRVQRVRKRLKIRRLVDHFRSLFIRFLLAGELTDERGCLPDYITMTVLECQDQRIGPADKKGPRMGGPFETVANRSPGTRRDQDGWVGWSARFCLISLTLSTKSSACFLNASRSAGVSTMSALRRYRRFR